MRLDKLPFAVFNVINKHGLIKSNDSVIVGVSGGPDSVALLKTLQSINLTKRLHLSLFVAHLNHQLRGKSSEKDALFVQDLSNEISLPFFLKEVNIQEIANKTKRSIEEAARIERYKFFGELSQRHNASAVALGHTADDNAETLVHRIIRGTGLIGLEGIPIKRPLVTGSSVQLIRPFLFTWRKEIIEYLKREETAYRTDETNYETTYLRNKIRLELLPLLEEQYNPNIKNTLVQLCQILNENNEYLLQEIKRILKDSTIESSADSYTVNTHFLTKQPRILQHLVLREVLSVLRISLKEIKYEHYTRIFDEITKRGKGRHLQLPGRLYLWHEHGKLYLRKGVTNKLCESFPDGIQEQKLSEITLQIPGTTCIPAMGQIVSGVIDARNLSLETYKKTKSRYEEIFDLQNIAMPLAVRLRKDGDAISPLGVQGHKKLKEIFIDKRIPLKERDAIPIVVMNNQPVWVVGICIDNRVKVTPATKKVLRLTFQKRQ